jgi:transposase-like protein
MSAKQMTFLEFNQMFPVEEAAIAYFLHVRYNDQKAEYSYTLKCPHCGETLYVYHYSSRMKVCHCHNCNNTFSPFTGTIFEKSSTDMRKWFYAIHLFLNAKKGISACQLQREIGVMYKTAWRMLKQIRTAMGNVNMAKSFEALVEIDETYVGGKPRKENAQLDSNGNVIPSFTPPAKRGRGTKKTPVIGIKERNTKKVYAQVAFPNKYGKKLTGKQLLNVLDKVCKDKYEDQNGYEHNTTVVSDEFKGYNILDKKTQFVHLSVNHSLGQFSNGNGIHTNGIEGFWANLKRGVYGIYHHISIKYMQKYVDEFCFRQNNKEYSSAFDAVLSQSVLKLVA